MTAQYGPPRAAATSSGLAGKVYAGAQSPNLDQPYAGESYYGVEPIKASHYRWLIAGYFFVGGLASAAQFIATIADLVGGRRDRSTVRAGRYLALLGALASPVLLIADLHLPRRWLNMLRIYRGTSAMSIGSWALSIFGAFSGLTAAGQLADDAGLAAGGWLARVCQLPAALAGGVVALYTGTLLAATNMPLVSAAYPFLSSLFASSAASTAAAALTLAAEATGAPLSSKRRLNTFATIAGATELAFALWIERNWGRHQLNDDLAQDAVGKVYRGGVLGLGITAPLAVHAAQAVTRQESRSANVLASLAVLAGGLLLRAVFIIGGNTSSRRPESYFRMAGRQYDR